MDSRDKLPFGGMSQLLTSFTQENECKRISCEKGKSDSRSTQKNTRLLKLEIHEDSDFAFGKKKKVNRDEVLKAATIACVPYKATLLSRIRNNHSSGFSGMVS